MKKWIVLCGCVVLFTPMLQAQTAWLPPAGELDISPSYTFQSFDEFWAGRDTKVKLPDSVNQHTAWVGFDYGITDRWAADASLGYTWVASTEAFGGNAKDDGLADTSLGLRYLLAKEEDYECPFMPSIAIRGGVIIEGTYDENTPFSAGDGASGLEGSFLFTKTICPGFGLFGDIGYRARNHHVPDDLFGFAGLYVQYRALTASFGYRHVQSLSGQDIGPDPFTFPELKEINQNLELSMGFSDQGGRLYQIFYAHTIDGRNTGEKDIVGASISIPLDVGAAGR